MASALTIRDFASADAEAVNGLAVAAFAPLAPHYRDWPAMAASLAKMSALAASGEVIALHTSPIMTVALPMYLRMGFERLRDAPPIRGVYYAVYTKML